MRDLIELIRVISWPVLVVGVLVAFYRPLTRFLRDVGKRATKLSAFHIELELASLQEGQIGPLTTQIRELRQPGQMVSSLFDLLERLKGDSMDYVVIDLGDGMQWLTSRLFIFAVILERMRDLKCFVFVRSSPETPSVFLGTAVPARVRWSLAQRFPGLERALATAYAGAIAQNPEHLQLIYSTSGALDTNTAINLVTNFLNLIQIPGTAPGYIPLEEAGTSERAEWINAANLEQYLGSVLQLSWVDASPHRSRSQRFEAILRCQGSFCRIGGTEPEVPGTHRSPNSAGAVSPSSSRSGPELT